MTIYGKLLFIVTLCSVFETLMATSEVSGQCMTEHNIPGMALKGHTFKRSVVRAPYMCDFKCEQDVRCQSFNYVIQENVCELNNGTKEEKPEYFVRDPERFYIKRLSKVPRKAYAFQFLQNESDDFVHVEGLPDLTQFTVCLWMQSDDTESQGCPISYALPEEHNELVIYNYNAFRLCIGGLFKATSVSATDGKWHHICASWENTAGSWKFYKDGDVRAQGSDLKTGHVIKSGGSFLLGIEQDSPGGGFEVYESFRGMMTNVNLWDHVLSAEEIESLSKSCLSGKGNVLKWSHFTHGRKGNTKLVIPSPCESLNG
ncbi:neuronal pentraxin-2-like [Oculina patagonica]